MSTFTFESSAKKLNSSTLKPHALAKIFNIDLSTLSVIDQDTGDVHDANGSEFVPLLPASGKFEVNGQKHVTSTAVVTANSQTGVANNQMPPKPVLTVAIRREKMIADVIRESKDMNESALMLHHAPQAVILVESLTILAACTRDPSLVSDDYPASRFKRLTCPTSFKASLYEVSSHICTAFRTADSSMNKIRMALIDLPDYFETTLKAISNTDDSASRDVMQSTLRVMEASSKMCITAAENTKKAFDGVIEDIDELVMASQMSKTTNERNLAENEKLKVDYELQKEQRELELKEQEEEYRERKERVEKALKEYDKEMAEMRDKGSLFAAAFTDFLLDTLSSGRNIIADVASELRPTSVVGRVTNAAKNIGNIVGVYESDSLNLSKTFRAAAEAGLTSVLENVHAELECPETLGESRNELLGALQAGVKFGAHTDSGKIAVKQANMLIKFLEKSSQQQIADAEIVSIKAGLMHTINVLEEAKRERAREQMAKEKHAEKARASLVEIGTKRLNSAQTMYQEAEERAEQIRKELATNRRGMTELASKLANLDLEKVDMDDVIKYLADGIRTLSRVKESWSNVTRFFQDIHDIVSGPLARNVSGFIENAQHGNVMQSRIAQGELLRLSLKACGLRTQITACAEIYSDVSKKHIMPVINAVGINLGLTPGQAQQKRSMIEQRMFDVQDEVETLVQRRIQAAEDTVKGLVGEYAQHYQAALEDQK